MAQSTKIEILKRDPKRGYGTKGHSIKLKANSFEVTLSNLDFLFYHYNVVIEKWIDKKGKRKQKEKKKEVEDKEVRKLSRSTSRFVFEKFCEDYKLKEYNIGYDGEKNAYSLKKIKNKLKVVVDIKPENKLGYGNQEGTKKNDKRVHTSRYKFNVSLENVSSINFRDLFDFSKTYLAENQDSSPLQALNVMFHSYYAQKLQPLSSCRFFSVDEQYGSKTKSIEGGVLAVQGFFANLRPHGWKGETLLMKLNVSYATFYEPLPVIEFLKKKNIKFDAKPLEKSALKTARRILKGLNIQRDVWYKTLDNKLENRVQTHRVYSITEKGADMLKFSSDGKEITVKDYTENRKGDRLKYPHLNCLHVDNPENTIWIPMEEATIKKGQRAHVEFSSDEFKELIKFATNKPRVLYDKIMDIRRKGEFDNLAIINDVGMRISNEMLKFTGRVIPPPELLMRQGRKDLSITPKNGSWDLFKNEVFKAINLENWIILNFDEDFNHSIGDFIYKMKKNGRHLGVDIKHPKYQRNFSSSDLNFKEFKSEELQLIFCIMFEKRGSLYAQIKQAGDIDSKILTQCAKTSIAQKAIDKSAVMKNIILQINAKLGGINYIINPKQMKFSEAIIMGADVNHPSPGKHKDDIVPPSFAAVVASYDEYATKYAGLRRAQKGRMEVSNIENLKDMTKKLLKNYYSSTGKKPKRIIMYRDGVGESQFLKILSHEVFAIREACSELEAEYKPGITFICVQKRNQTRFFLDNDKIEGNVPPGTVDDKNVTDKNFMDFFLISHAGNEGTSKPGHYVVLWDDNELHMDELQALTYNLCHISPRTPKAISRPFPVLYAHLVAYRGHTLYNLLANPSDSSSSSGSTENDIIEVDTSSIELTDTNSALFKLMHCL